MPSLRRLAPRAAALAALAALFGITHASAARPTPSDVPRSYSFERMPIAMPSGYDQLAKRSVREVNPAYEHIRSWVSSVGAAVALNDVVGNGREDGMCLVDPRTDRVVVTYAPTAPAEDQFPPFLLEPTAVPTSDTMAPMGCVPGDFNTDGHNDFLVYFWGRTPVLFLGKAGAPSATSFVEADVVPTGSQTETYAGQLWNTNAVLISDLNGDSHPDLIVGNYFPQSGVLDPHGRKDVYMNDSMSRATNAGGLRVLRWTRNDPSGKPEYVEDKLAVPFEDASGWTLGLGAGDLTGDQLPEVYVANDFGHDHLLYNQSTREEIRFTTAVGDRGPTTPKSFVLGQGSFKGMGVDFVDLDRRGKFDLLVSNITTAWGLEESNFLWRNEAHSSEEMKTNLEQGRATFTQTARERGLAWTGWGWDIKAADFTNSGFPDIVQADGFVKGNVNRWAWLQELATANDVLLREPEMWPHSKPGDDIAGHQELAFYARSTDGNFANITTAIGTDIPTPSRGVAIADTTSTGAMDFAVAYQWDEPVFYKNTSPQRGSFMELRLVRPAGTGFSPVYGASATLTTADGKTQLAQLDGGSGHSGKRGFAVHFGLGAHTEASSVTLHWRDSEGSPRSQDLTLMPGLHTVVLTNQAQVK